MSDLTTKLDEHATKYPAHWLIGVFALVVLGTVVGGGWLYRSQRASLQTEAERNLETIAQFKVAQIIEWRPNDGRMARAHGKSVFY